MLEARAHTCMRNGQRSAQERATGHCPADRGSARREEDVSVEAEEVVGPEAAQVIGPGEHLVVGEVATSGHEAGDEVDKAVAVDVLAVVGVQQRQDADSG